jgi:hypothetical protein
MEKRFYLTMEVEVLAENRVEAMELGRGAIEHLLETFNDDNSLTSNYGVTAKEID